MDPAQTNLMAALGLDKLPEAEQIELYNKIGGVLFQGILIRAIESMDETQQDALDKFLGEHPDDPDALMEYLRTNVKDFDALAEDEVARFKASAMELMAKDENKA